MRRLSSADTGAQAVIRLCYRGHIPIVPLMMDADADLNGSTYQLE